MEALPPGTDYVAWETQPRRLAATLAQKAAEPPPAPPATTTHELSKEAITESEDEPVEPGAASQQPCAVDDLIGEADDELVVEEEEDERIVTEIWDLPTAQAKAISVEAILRTKIDLAAKGISSSPRVIGRYKRLPGSNMKVHFNEKPTLFGELSAEQVERRIVYTYRQLNADKVEDVPRLMEKYRGKEDALLAAIVKKYELGEDFFDDI